MTLGVRASNSNLGRSQDLILDLHSDVVLYRWETMRCNHWLIAVIWNHALREHDAWGVIVGHVSFDVEPIIIHL